MSLALLLLTTNSPGMLHVTRNLAHVQDQPLCKVERSGSAGTEISSIRREGGKLAGIRTEFPIDPMESPPLVEEYVWAGNALAERRFGDEATPFEPSIERWSWEGGQLRSIRQSSPGELEQFAHRTVFSWSKGRLTGATQHWGDRHAWTAELTYDAEGRPAEVSVRTESGELLNSVAYSYTDGHISKQVWTEGERRSELRFVWEGERLEAVESDDPRSGVKLTYCD